LRRRRSVVCGKILKRFSEFVGFISFADFIDFGWLISFLVSCARMARSHQETPPYNLL
jgi:hypothetical protein